MNNKNKDIQQEPMKCPICYKNDVVWSDILQGYVYCEDCQKEIRKGTVQPNSQLPSHYRVATFGDFPKAIQNKVWKGTEKFTKSLVLYGDCQIGKTHLLSALSNLLHARCKPHVFMVWNEFVSEIQASFSDGSTQSRLDKVCQVDYLIIDDIFTEKSTDFKSSTLYKIINYRQAHELPTFLSYNGTLETLQQHDNRIFWRLLDNGIGLDLGEYLDKEGKWTC